MTWTTFYPQQKTLEVDKHNMSADRVIPASKIPTPEEWIAQSEKFTSRRGHSISYRRRGTGQPLLLLHGFPTWSYDYAAVATDLESDHDVTTFDFLGYGASDKPNPYDYTATEGADTVEDLLAHLGLPSVHLVVHDFGGLVGQELLSRRADEKSSFEITRFTMLNCGIVYSAYRPTRIQRLLNLPFIGKIVAGQITADKLRAGFEGVWGTRSKLTDQEFQGLWYGIALKDGHKISHLLVRYNRERVHAHQRWWDAMVKYDGPLSLIWGFDDPVSGRHILEPAEKGLPKAIVTRLEGVEHFPQVEAPNETAAAIRGK